MLSTPALPLLFHGCPVLPGLPGGFARVFFRRSDGLPTTEQFLPSLISRRISLALPLESRCFSPVRGRAQYILINTISDQNGS